MEKVDNQFRNDFVIMYMKLVLLQYFLIFTFDQTNSGENMLMPTPPLLNVCK